MIHFFFLRKSECYSTMTAFPTQCCDLGFDLCTHDQNTQGRRQLCSDPQSLSSPCKVHPVHVGYTLTILQRGVHFLDTCCLENTHCRSQWLQPARCFAKSPDICSSLSEEETPWSVHVLQASHRDQRGHLTLFFSKDQASQTPCIDGGWVQEVPPLSEDLLAIGGCWGKG